MNTKERKVYKDKLSKLELTAVKVRCYSADDEIADLARGEYVNRLVTMLVDDLLGYDEPGWHSVSPMYGAIEYQGVMPQDVRKSGGDRMMNAALKLKNKSEGWQLMSLVPPRQLVALVVNDMRERLGLTQAEACVVQSWEILIGLLQLSRFFTPAASGVMTIGSLMKAVSVAKSSLKSEWMEIPLAA
jgi:hypothetical protein